MDQRTATRDSVGTSLGEVVALAALAKLLGVGTRLELLMAIVSKPGSVQELAARMSLDASLLSHHLRALRCAGLAEATSRGHERIYRTTQRVQRVRWSAGESRVVIHSTDGVSITLDAGCLEASV